jgi:hypothetical protein
VSAVVRVVVSAAARTASGNSGLLAIQDDQAQSLALLLSVTAASGTGPTLDVSVEWSHGDNVRRGRSD